MDKVTTSLEADYGDEVESEMQIEQEARVQQNGETRRYMNQELQTELERCRLYKSDGKREIYAEK